MVNDLSDSYLASALRLLEEVDSNDQCHRQNGKIVLSCISSFLSLESSINRAYFEIFKTEQIYKKPIRSGIPSVLSNYIKQNWNRLSIKEKYLLLPPLISDFEFDVNNKPFTLFNEFIVFRNSLIHSKSWETEHSILVDNIDLDENNSGSWGGSLLNTRHLEDKADPYPLTDFSIDISKLTRSDAEKSLEIACLLRLKLFEHTKTTFPNFHFDPPRNGEHVVMGEDVLNYFTRHFVDNENNTA